MDLFFNLFLFLKTISFLHFEGVACQVLVLHHGLDRVTFLFNISVEILQVFEEQLDPEGLFFAKLTLRLLDLAFVPLQHSLLELKHLVIELLIWIIFLFLFDDRLVHAMTFDKAFRYIYIFADHVACLALRVDLRIS